MWPGVRHLDVALGFRLLNNRIDGPSDYALIKMRKGHQHTLKNPHSLFTDPQPNLFRQLTKYSPTVIPEPAMGACCRGKPEVWHQMPQRHCIEKEGANANSANLDEGRREE